MGNGKWCQGRCQVSFFIKKPQFPFGILRFDKLFEEKDISLIFKKFYKKDEILSIDFFDH